MGEESLDGALEAREAEGSKEALGATSLLLDNVLSGGELGERVRRPRCVRLLWPSVEEQAAGI